MNKRNIEETFFDIALVWAQRSTCSAKIAVGAVLVNSFNQIIASGYNGSPRGMPHCNDVGCDDTGDGKFHRVIHAETNAILMCAFTGTSSKGSRIFTTYFPCLRCAQLIVQAGIIEVVYLHSLGDKTVVEQLLQFAEIPIRLFR